MAHDGARWLPRTLSALAEQTRPPDEVVGVDTSSSDDSVGILRTRVDHVLTSAARAGILDCVAAAAAASDTAHLQPGSGPYTSWGGPRAGGQEWLWLLHDDSAPAPDALARLLEAVERAPSVAVAGCKQRGWDRPARLLETGSSLSPLGRPITGVEAGEVDQGQTDDRDDVLAVGTAGMLVRRDVWDDLGGGDPATPAVGADLDLCRRARLAGHRVLVVPGAVVAHADATRAGLRRGPHAGRGLRWADRRSATHRRLAGTPAPLLPLTVLALALGAVCRCLGRVAAKEPRRAGAELTAVLAALARPDQVWRARRSVARTRSLPRRALRPLTARWRDVLRWHRDRWQRRRLARRSGLSAAERPGPSAGGWKVPAVLTAALTAVSVLALARLLGPGTVSGGALAPAPGSLGDLWASARSSWRTAGLGSPGPADPFLSTLTLLSAPVASPALAVTALLVAAVPLAGLGAWCAAGAATRSAWLRGWAALTWAAAPPLLAALDGGRLGALVAHVALPWVVFATARALTATTTRRACTAAAVGGLALAVASSAAPVLLPTGLVLLVAVGATSRAGRRSLALLLTALPALVMSGPRLVGAVDSPRLLFSDPGLPTASGAPATLLSLTGHPAALRPWPWLPGEAATTVAASAGAVLLVLAMLALLRGGTRGVAVRAGWLVVLVGLAAALLASRVVVGVDDDGTVTAWPGAGTSLVVAGLLVAALAALDGARRRLRGRRLAPRRLLAGVVAVGAVVAPAGTLAAWAVEQAAGGGQVTRGPVAALPTVAADAAASPDRTRTLVVRPMPDGAVGAAVARHATDHLDGAPAADAARGVTGGLTGAVPAPPDPAQVAVGDAVAALTAGADPRPVLADLGVGYVLLLAAGDRDLAPLDADALDAVPGLARSGEVGSGMLWRVAPASGEDPAAPDRSARARVLAADGTPQAVLAAGPVDVRAEVPDGEPGRLLVLAERADAGWVAHLGSRQLEPAVHGGWAQAFELPPIGGRVVVEHRDPGQAGWDAAQVLVVGLTVLVAMPLGGSSRRVVRR